MLWHLRREQAARKGKEYRTADGVSAQHSSQLGLPPGKAASSVTHPAEWAAFSRACSGRKPYLTEISPYIASDKADLFNVWLANNRDISACLLVMRRRQVKRTKFARQWQYLKKRDLKTMYGGDMEKVKQGGGAQEEGRSLREGRALPGR